MSYAKGTRPKTQNWFCFNRRQLPSPADYYAAQGLMLSGGGEWKDALCPFHQDTKPSLRIRLDNGAFRCMVCGEHGGDVLKFHMLKTGLTFVDACKDLGAWQL